MTSYTLLGAVIDKLRGVHLPETDMSEQDSYDFKAGLMNGWTMAMSQVHSALHELARECGVESQLSKQIDYVKRGGLYCPWCGSMEINGGAVEINGGAVDVDEGGAKQECTCVDCGAAWNDIHILTGYVLVEEGKKHG